jgi:putative transposase
VQDDRHLLTVCRYVERNAVRAVLPGVERAEDWRWSSLWRWHHGGEEAKALLSPWPVPQSPGSDRWHRPRTWLQIVNTPISGPELEALRVSAQRGRPFGESIWVGTMVQRHGLAATTRNPGRPRREDP